MSDHGQVPERPAPTTPSAVPPGGPDAASGATTEQRFLSSTVAAYGSQMGRILIRFATDMILARLILPDEHGVFELALGAVMIGTVVRDAGLSYHLVRDRREPYGPVLAWTVGAGVLVTVALAAGSPLFALLAPELPAVVAALAPFVLLDGLAMVPRVWFERHLRVGRLVVPEIARGATFAAVSIGLATLGADVWSFVAGELAGLAVLATILWVRAWGRIPLAMGGVRIGDLLARSRYLFVIALGAFTLPFAERFVLGPFVTTAVMGQYVKARMWGLRIQTIVLPAVQRVFYPTLVAYGDDPDQSFPVYRIGTVTILALEVLAAYFLFLNAEVVLLEIVLGGPEWRGAVPLMKILCFLPLVDPLSRLGGEILKARHEDRPWLVLVVVNMASLLVFGFFLARAHGATGIAIANFLLLGNLIMVWRIVRVYGRRLWRLVGDLALVYGLPALPFAAVVWIFPEPGWPRFFASFPAGAAGAALLALRFYRPFREFFAGRTELPPGTPEEAPHEP